MLNDAETGGVNAACSDRRRRSSYQSVTDLPAQPGLFRDFARGASQQRMVLGVAGGDGGSHCKAITFCNI